MSNQTLNPWPVCEPRADDDAGAALSRLAAGEIAAIILRQAFPAAECRELVRFLIEKELMFDLDDPRIEETSIAPDRVDRWTRQGLNPADSARRRIDIGTSLGNLGDDKEQFLAHAAETHRLFARLFAERRNPVLCLYEHLEQLAAGKRVMTACEPDGRLYGPAIFRVHYGGYTYGPHFDSVRLRENRSGYAVHRFGSQLAGVLCIQNAVRDGRTAQAILHRQFWTPDIDPLLKAGGFHKYAARERIADVRVELEPGDLYFFNTQMIHEVPGVDGDLPRIVLATFIGYDDDDADVMVWS